LNTPVERTDFVSLACVDGWLRATDSVESGLGS